MLPPEAVQNSHQAQPSIWFCCRGDWQVGGPSWPPDVRPLGRSLPSPAAAERSEVRLGAPGTQYRTPGEPPGNGGLLSPWKNEETWGSLVLRGMWEE